MIQAMILAAGLGKRLEHLTATNPKPLLCVRGKPLIAYALESLKAAGIKRCVINTHYLGEKIEDYVRDGRAWNMEVCYSREERLLGTGGGIKHALPLLGETPFLLMNCDIVHNANIERFVNNNLPSLQEGHLLLHKEEIHTDGDFRLAQGRVCIGTGWTYCGISLLDPKIFCAEKRSVFNLGENLRMCAQQGTLTGEEHTGDWIDLGTLKNIAYFEKKN